MELLRRAHADLATINLVENALAERRPCMVELTLTDASARADRSQSCSHAIRMTAKLLGPG
jgi:hypothetical protein